MSLTGKEKSNLRADGNTLKPEVWIGKEGISEGTLQAIENSFRTKELIKIKLQESFPEDTREAGKKLSEKAGAELVQVIGNTILLYRPLPEKKA